MAEKLRPCSGCGRNRSERFFSSSRGHTCSDCLRKSRRKTARSVRLRTVYEISSEEYDALYAYQNGECAGCGGTRRYNLAVDHDHKVEKEEGSRASVRGLLCKRCNGILRDAWDNPETLRALAEYLEHPPASRVLQY